MENSEIHPNGYAAKHSINHPAKPTSWGICRMVVLVLMLWLGVDRLVLPASAQPESDGITWRAKRAEREEDYLNRLTELAGWCDEQGLTNEAAHTRAMLTPRDWGRQTIFIPEQSAAQKRVDGLAGQWQARLDEINHWQADRIFELATQAAAEDAGQVAIQWLNEVLHLDPDRQNVRRMLGHRSADDGWQLYSDRLRIRRSSSVQKIVGWPAGSFWEANTANFQVYSNASEAETKTLCEKLERWHYVWRQAFFEYWANPRSVRRWIVGDGSFSHPRRKHQVIFLRDRRTYLATLASLGPAVEQSHGYYSNSQSCSFFYLDNDPTIESTWRHELTHQLFRESIGSGKNLRVLETKLVWLDEGMATYFESLVDFGPFVTLGGLDASRIQYARMRQVREGYQVPLRELSALGRLEFQKRTDLVALYSQIASQIDMLINDHQGANEIPLMTLLASVYRGKTMRDAWVEEMLGGSYEVLDQRFPEYLQIESGWPATYLKAPELKTELSFPFANLSLTDWERIGKCRRLTWLDVTGNRILPEHLAQLESCQVLVQIIMTQCQIEPRALGQLKRLPQLQELDLRNANLNDAMLLELAGLTGLKRIYLQGSAVTAAGIQQLQQSLPQLEIRR